MAKLKIVVDSTRAKAGASESKKAIDGIKTSAFGAAKGLAALAGGFSAIYALRDLTRVIAGFGQTMSTLQAVTGATGGQFKAMESTVRALGASTRFSAQEAGEGMVFLARAGFSAQESIAALPSTLDLAAAGALELGSAADYASNILSQFNMNASEMNHVADVLVTTANSANTNVYQMAEALKYAGSVAGAVGISLEEAAAAIGVMGDRGIQASMAGTNLRGIISALIKPTDTAREAIKDMELSLAELDPKTHSLVEIFKKFHDANMNATQALQIFNKLNVSGAIAITQSIDKLSELTKKNKESDDVAKRAAATMSDNLAGSFKTLRSSIEEAYLQIGDEGFAGGLKNMVDIGTEAVRIMTGLSDSSSEFSSQGQIVVNVLKAMGTAASIFVGYKLAAAFIGIKIALTANPIFTLAGVIGGIVTATQLWGEKLDVVSSKLKGLDISKLEAITGGYLTAEGAKQRALGQGDINKVANQYTQQLGILERVADQIKTDMITKGKGAAIKLEDLISLDINPQYLTDLYEHTLIEALKGLKTRAAIRQALKESPFLASTYAFKGPASVTMGEQEIGIPATPAWKKEEVYGWLDESKLVAISAADALKEVELAIGRVTEKVESYGTASEQAAESVKKVAEESRKGSSESLEFGRAVEKASEAFQEQQQEAENLASTISSSLAGSFTSSLRSAESFADAMKNIFSNLTDSLINMFLQRGLYQLLMSMFSPTAPNVTGIGNYPMWVAQGAAFSGGEVIPFAYGGVVSKPTWFPLAGGRTGVMGEKEPEAVMPLERGPGGKLGVKASGWGGVVIHMKVITNDANSFRQARHQIQNDMYDALQRVT